MTFAYRSFCFVATPKMTPFSRYLQLLRLCRKMKHTPLISPVVELCVSHLRIGIYFGRYMNS